MFKKSLLFISAIFAFSPQVNAAPNKMAIEQSVENQLGLAVQQINPSPVTGLASVLTDKGLFYVSDDGQYLFHGNLFNIKQGMKNETEAAMLSVREEAIKQYQEDSITYKAKNEKYVINVFTDITCGYCRKMHEQIKGYNDLGITVHYFAFPRGGLASQSYNDMVSVWCANDPQKALTDAKMNGNVVAKTCSNTVKEQYEIGGQLGVSGTPAVVLNNGTMIPGYRPPADMLKILQGV